MTSLQLFDAAQVMEAASEGKTIEVRKRATPIQDEGKWTPMHPEVISWDWSFSEYRVAPDKPKTLGQVLFEAWNAGALWPNVTERGKSDFERMAAAVEAEVLKRNGLPPT